MATKIRSIATAICDTPDCTSTFEVDTTDMLSDLQEAQTAHALEDAGWFVKFGLCFCPKCSVPLEGVNWRNDINISIEDRISDHFVLLNYSLSKIQIPDGRWLIIKLSVPTVEDIRYQATAPAPKDGIAAVLRPTDEVQFETPNGTVRLKASMIVDNADILAFIAAADRTIRYWQDMAAASATDKQ